MKRILQALLTAALFLAAAPALLAQEQQEPDMDAIILKQVDNLTAVYKLDDV